jgi:hypothetical protein
MDNYYNYSKLKKLDLSPILSLESVSVSVKAKGLLISNPTNTPRSIIATVKTPDGASTVLVTIYAPAFSNNIINQRITALDGSAASISLNVFELY